MSPKKAIVAVAHKLLVVVWHVLTDRTADTEAVPEMVTSKLIGWSGGFGGGGAWRAHHSPVRALSLDATEDGRRSEGCQAGAQDAPAGFTGGDPGPSARIDVRPLIG